MPTALVLSAGGMFAAWEIGVWKALRPHFTPDFIVGASAGAWTGWCLAGDATCDQLEAQWLDPALGRILSSYSLHRSGFLKPDLLYDKARNLYSEFKPRVPFALTMVEVPRMRLRVVRDAEITWEHLAGTASIPFAFPPIRIGGRRYVDGGFLGSLPLCAAEDVGATRAIALNCLNIPAYRFFHAINRPFLPKASKALRVTLIEPSKPIGSLIDSYRWSPDVIRRAIDLGEQDGLKAIPSITM